MAMKEQNDYSRLGFLVFLSLFLALAIFYFLIPFEELESHGWLTQIISFVIVWYIIYLLLVVSVIFIWEKLSNKLITKGRSEL
jgi:tryptophan-rich sensory protein